VSLRWGAGRPVSCVRWHCNQHGAAEVRRLPNREPGAGVELVSNDGAMVCAKLCSVWSGESVTCGPTPQVPALARPFGLSSGQRWKQGAAQEPHRAPREHGARGVEAQKGPTAAGLCPVLLQHARRRFCTALCAPHCTRVGLPNRMLLNCEARQ
jgi:hypothetical protein